MTSAVARKKAKTIAESSKPIISFRSVRSFRSSLKSSRTINSIVKTSKKLFHSLQRNFIKRKQGTFSKAEMPEDELLGQKDIISAQAVERYKVKANQDNFAVHGGYRKIPHPFYHDIPRRHPARILHIPLRMESEETFFFLGFTTEKTKQLWLEYSGNDITSQNLVTSSRLLRLTLSWLLVPRIGCLPSNPQPTAGRATSVYERGRNAQIRTSSSSIHRHQY